MGAPLGNENNRKGRIWQSAIHQALEKRGAGDRMEALRAIADRLIDQAEAGDMAALKELGDRIDGRAAQALTVTGDDEGGPVRHLFEWAK